MSDGRPISKILFRTRRFLSRIWVRTSAFALLALVTALLSQIVAPVIPEVLARGVETDAILAILTVLSSSMLAVTTFSLGIMVSARQAITSGISPRAHSVVAEDPVTQSVLATFLGAFVYALTAQILIRTGLYDARATAVILMVSIVVIILVVMAIVGWIEHLTEIGSIPVTVAAIEAACAPAIRSWQAAPTFDAQPLAEVAAIPGDAAGVVTAPRSGYIQHIDIGGLHSAAEKSAFGYVFVLAPPGTFVVTGEPICRFAGDLDAGALAGNFTIATTRSYAMDPRFGMIVLSEIAQRALSPAINDPGTAIFILGRIVQLLIGDGHRRTAALPPSCDRVFVPPVSAADLLRDGFDPIARDGAAMIEVQIRLQKSLAALVHRGDADMARAAAQTAARALALAEAALVVEEDRMRLRARAVPARHAWTGVRLAAGTASRHRPEGSADPSE